MIRSCVCKALVVGFLLVGGCRHAIPAPYARGQGPTPQTLLAQTQAQVTALQVSNAKVTANRSARGNLAFIAEAPGRFRGSVDVAGNELVTLAFHEQGYALRYKMDAFPSGFYQGPPSACAVEALLGIPFDTEGLVDLVLGGAPVIAAPFEVLEQQWDRADGFERLSLRNDRLIEELGFTWAGGQWRVVSGELWERAGEGKGRRLWAVTHIDLQPEGSQYLPRKTRVSTRGKRRDNTVVINYKERNLEPAFVRGRPTLAPSIGASGGGSGSSPPTPNDPGPSDDPWDSDDPWEDESPAVSVAGPPPEGGATPVADPSPDPTAPPMPRSSIPPEFQLESAGLIPRGDLCRSPRHGPG